jgi:HK97 family phage portal protein
MEKLGINPKDLDWLATNSMTMKEICGIFKVPPSMLGIVDDVNRATAESQEYTFAKAAIEPILTSFDQRITKDLLRYYLDGQRLFMKHDSTVPMDELRRAQAGQYRISSGQTTINEERKEQGYNGVTGGDTLLVPANLTTIDKLIAGENNPTNQPDLTNGDGNG